MRQAVEWLARFEGAGLDGVIAKPVDGTYQPGKRAMIKVKHARTADCVVAGFRWHKDGRERLVGSLLLGLYDDAGRLQHVGVTSAFTMAMRAQLASELAPLREHALEGHPWREWADVQGETTRMPGGQSRWSAGKDLSWEPLRIERVCEVKYDHMQGDRFRHAAVFQRWRPDKPPSDCGYDQLEVTTPYELRRSSARLTESLTPPVVGHVLVGVSGSCAGRSASGTCCRFTRMRVHVRKRPRIASTSTSASFRCPAASGWRAFHRSNPARASAFSRARPISMSGRVGVRRRDGATRGCSPACFR